MSTRIAVLFLAAISVRAQDATGSVTGTLRFPGDGRLPYFPVTLDLPNGSHRDGQTDNRGVYSFASLPAGAYFLHLNATWASPRAVQFDLNAGEQRVLPPVELEVFRTCNFDPQASYIRFLAPESSSGSLTGTIRETKEEDSAPVAGAGVFLSCSSGQACGRRTANTDSRGFFAFEDLAPGTYGFDISYDIKHWVFIDAYRVKAGIETSYSFGLNPTPGENNPRPVVYE